jgi:hypothetical protein
MPEAASVTFQLVVIIYSVFCCFDKKPGRRETVLTREKKRREQKNADFSVSKMRAR